MFVDDKVIMIITPPILWGLSIIAGLADSRAAAWLSSASSTTCILSGVLLLTRLGGGAVHVTLHQLRLGPVTWAPSLGIDSLGASFLIALGACTLIASALTNYYWSLGGLRLPRSYLSLFYASMASMYMVLVSRDLVTLLVSWEAMSFTLGLLIMYEGGAEARRSSIYYLILMHAVSLPMFISFALALSTGVCSYYELGSLPAGARGLLTISILAAFTAKSGLFPFYSWLPPAHSRAPSDASVLLSGFSVKPSIYQWLLLSSMLGVDGRVCFSIIALSIASIVIGCVGALWSREGKRILAYTTIVYMGLAWILASLAVASGGLGALYTALSILIVSHAIYKSLAFTMVGLCKRVWGTDELGVMGGLCSPGSKLCGLASLTALSMLSIPPFARFVGELGVILAVAHALLFNPGLKILVGFIIVIIASSAAVTLGYNRVLAACLSPSTPPGRRASGGLGPRVIASIAVVSPALAIAPASIVLSYKAGVILYATVAVGIMAGVLLYKKLGVLREEPWVSGEPRAWPVASGLQPLSIKPPRRSIEYYIMKPSLPRVREVSYGRVYYAVSGLLARLLSKLVYPSVRGGVLTYMGVMLAFFIAILIAVLLGVS